MRPDHPLQRRLASALFAVLWLAAAASGAVEGTLTAAEARHHVGERATVCGKVESTRYAASSRGRPTFLNLDKPFPGEIFTVVIWGENRAEFAEPPEAGYRGKRVCVTGEISSYGGVPQIVLESPGQLAVVREERSAPVTPAPPPRARGCTARWECCKVCTSGKACGDSCIRRSYTCPRGRGCACNSWEVCS
jgi:hypothetical protein